MGEFPAWASQLRTEAYRMALKSSARWVLENRLLTPNFAIMLIWVVVGVTGWFLGWRNSIAAVYVLSIAALTETRGAAWFAEWKLMKEVKRKELDE